MSDEDRKFLLIEGIDTSVTVRDLITCFQQCSSVRFTVRRNMDPENLRAVLGKIAFSYFLLLLYRLFG